MGIIVQMSLSRGTRKSVAIMCCSYSDKASSLCIYRQHESYNLCIAQSTSNHVYVFIYTCICVFVCVFCETFFSLTENPTPPSIQLVFAGRVHYVIIIYLINQSNFSSFLTTHRELINPHFLNWLLCEMDVYELIV